MSNWFVEQRLAWIKESIEIFGFILREHIMMKFGVSTAQASLDIRKVLARWPDLTEYNNSTKRYERKTKHYELIDDLGSVEGHAADTGSSERPRE
jgi:hypothetical protein